MDNSFVEEISVGLCICMLVLMLISSIIITLLVYNLNFSPNSYFIKRETCRILKKYFSNKLSNIFLACAYRSRFFFLNGILTYLIGMIFINWIFGIIYLPIFWQYSDNYSTFICNLCIICFALMFNIVDCITSIIFWKLVKKWRIKYSEENLKENFINLSNQTNLNEIIVYDPIGFKNENFKKYLIGPLIYFSLAIKKISKNKINNDKKIKDKIYTIFYKTFFLLTRNIKWIEFKNDNFILFKFKFNESSDFFSILELLKIINDILITLFNFENSKEQIQFLNNHIEKILY